MDFRIWLERSEDLDDPITVAILGVVAPDQSLSDDDKERELSRNTNELSSDIQDNLKELGVVKEAPDYKGVVASLESGVTIKDLIEKVRGQDYAPNADGSPVADPRAPAQEPAPYPVQDTPSAE